MSNYKKDKSYIKQRLEYVSPVDYISELEGKIEYLEYLNNERLNNIIDELEELIDSYELGKYDYQIPVYVLKEKLEKLRRVNNG